MRLSFKTQYGLQALLELALAPAGGEKRAGEIAKAQNIPLRFLEQILQVLKRQGLVVSSRGKQGGYSLAKKAEQITLLKVIEALEGNIQFGVKGKRPSVVIEALDELEDKVRKAADKSTLEDLLVRKRRKEGVMLYHI